MFNAKRCKAVVEEMDAKDDEIRKQKERRLAEFREAQNVELENIKIAWVRQNVEFLTRTLRDDIDRRIKSQTKDSSGWPVTFTITASTENLKKRLKELRHPDSTADFCKDLDDIVGFLAVQLSVVLGRHVAAALENQDEYEWIVKIGNGLIKADAVILHYDLFVYDTKEQMLL